MTKHSNRELWLSLIAMLIIGSIYAIVVLLTKNVPASAGLFGHLLGIIGFIMMLMTEILYSLRKRSRLARWGRMEFWLQFHIFTGLVGPFMVLLHTSWKFNGLAGAVTLLTILIVASGFVGRYIYTASRAYWKELNWNRRKEKPRAQRWHGHAECCPSGMSFISRLG